METTNIKLNDQQFPEENGGKISFDDHLKRINRTICALDIDIWNQSKKKEVVLQPHTKMDDFPDDMLESSEDNDDDDELSRSEEALLEKLSSEISQRPEGKRRLNNNALILGVACNMTSSYNINSSGSLPRKRRRYQRRNSFVVRRNHLLFPSQAMTERERFHESVPDFDRPETDIHNQDKKYSMDCNVWGHASWSNTTDSDWFSLSPANATPKSKNTAVTRNTQMPPPPPLYHSSLEDGTSERSMGNDEFESAGQDDNSQNSHLMSVANVPSLSRMEVVYNNK